ncbi:MAG: hypothetical protein Tsb0020_26390 [Haliangiales bacterium]
MSKTPKDGPQPAKGARGRRAGRDGRPTRGDRAKRLLDLVMLLLRTRTPVSYREIREQFSAYMTANSEAGQRSFERDKSDLLELGVPIRYVTPEEDDTLEEGGYVIEWRRFRLPEVKLTPDEVSALLVAASVARAVPGGASPKIVDLALKKLAFDVQEMPDTPMDFLAQARSATRRDPVLVHFPRREERQSRELSDRFANIEAAIRNRKRLTVRYRNASSGAAQERDIDPYGMVYRRGVWYIVGYCHLRDDVRSFRFDRIEALEIGAKPKSPDFERPDDFDLHAYASPSPWTFTPERDEPIELEIRPQSADIANEDFGPDAARASVEGGAIRIRFRCGNPDYVVSRVLAAKGGLVIRDGARVRQRLSDEIAAIRERYPQ